MTQVILHKSSEGNLCITSPSPGFDVHKVAESAVPEGVDYQIVDKSEIDEAYSKYDALRNAWEYDDSITATAKGGSAKTYSELIPQL